MQLRSAWFRTKRTKSWRNSKSKVLLLQRRIQVSSLFLGIWLKIILKSRKTYKIFLYIFARMTFFQAEKSFIVQEKRRFMCHSFKGSTNPHAERVLMALGQAFEGKFWDISFTKNGIFYQNWKVAFQLKKTKTRFSSSEDSGVMNDNGSLPRNSDSESECSSFTEYTRRETLPHHDIYRWMWKFFLYIFYDVHLIFVQ